MGLPLAFAAMASALALHGPASAQSETTPYDGVYRLTAEADCAAGRRSEGLLRIDEGVLYGAESACRMTEPVAVRDMDATLYDMLCTGEGAAWQERALVMTGADGNLILVWNGFAFSYPACPAAIPRPRPRPDPDPETRSARR